MITPPGRIPVSILILTLDEEANLPYALRSVAEWAENVFIVDSGSTDRTIEIARDFGATVFHRNWTSYPDQLNWALENLPFTTDWIFRLDADEQVTPELASELAQKIPTLPSDVNGLVVKRRIHFHGRWIKHGGLYPTWLLRLIRRGQGYCENRVMDEHLVLFSGRAIELEHDIIDENHKDLTYWLRKHDRYADLERQEWLKLQAEAEQDGPAGSNQAKRKRWIKNNFYYSLPPFGRAFFYFIQRYFFRLGFLDGIPGLIFHVLQGFWYRFYVDAKIWEVEQRQKRTV